MAAEIATAIQAATLKVHQTDYYVRDREEKHIVLPQADFIHQIDVRGVFARYRAISYIRKWDPAGIDPQTQQMSGAAGVFLSQVDPEGILDAYGYTKPDTWYVGGYNLNIRSSTSLQHLLVGWYQMPKITPIANYSSWIADTVPFAIIFDASSTIFQMMAQQDQSRKFDGLVTEQLIMVRQHGLTSKGY
jgi:hypothetical protein